MTKDIIVSGSDDRYFPLIQELVASIRRDRTADHWTIAIIDGGLKDEQKSTLSKMGVIISPPYVPEYISKTKIAQRPNLAVNISKLWLNKLFPDFEKVLWIDADAWVQDHSVINMFFSASQDNILAIVPEKNSLPIRWLGPFFVQIRSFLYKSANHAGLPIAIKKNLSNKATLNAGAFALNTNSEYWHSMQKWQKIIARKGKLFTSDQLAIALSVYQDNLPVNLLPDTCNYMGPWRVDTNSGKIVEYYFPHKPVGVVHLACQEQMRTQTDHKIDVPDRQNMVHRISLRYAQTPQI